MFLGFPGEPHAMLTLASVALSTGLGPMMHRAQPLKVVKLMVVTMNLVITFRTIEYTTKISIFINVFTYTISPYHYRMPTHRPITR